jgi:large subunit ribosomal protein L25
VIVRKLNVFTRQDDVTAKQLRKQGYVPAIYYGEKQQPRKIAAAKKEINAMIARLGSNALYEIALENELKRVIIKEVQKDPVTNEVIHIDFQDMPENKWISLRVPLKYEGMDVLESRGIVLQRQAEAVNVEGHVNSIPSYICVYVGNMKGGQKIQIGDLNIGSEIRVLDPPDKIVAVAISDFK